jgi:lysophospholipase L1-like esterase
LNISASATGGEDEGRSTPLLLRLVFVIGLAFTLLGLVESAFIAYDKWSGGSLSAARAPDLGFGIRSWTVHHALRPGYTSPNVRINSMGLRSPEVAIPKPPQTIRVLLLGDSFTFGLRALDKDLFARRIEERLREKFAPLSVEVVNAGVLSYCPLLEYLQYRQQLHVLEPDLVILNFDMSDVQDHLAYSRDLTASPDGVPLFVTEPSLQRLAPSAMPKLLVFEWIGRRVDGLRGRVQSTLEGVAFVRDQDRYLWALEGGPEMDTEARSTMAPIANLAVLLRHHKIPLVLATYPQPWQVSADATSLPPIRAQYGIGYNTVHLNDRPFRKLAAFAAEQGIPFVDATAEFRRDAKPASLFLSNDFHFSPAGHALYGRVLSEFIIERGLLAGDR